MTHTAPAHWASHRIVEINRHTPFWGVFFRVSDERRQVIGAHLSAKPPARANMAEARAFLLGADIAQFSNPRPLSPTGKGERKLKTPGFARVPDGLLAQVHEIR